MPDGPRDEAFTRAGASALRPLALAAAVACPLFLAGLAVDSLPLRASSKPWIHLFLLAWVLGRENGAAGAYAKRIGGAIALCMVADFLLEFRHATFVHGIAVFLAGQLALARAFTLRSREMVPAAALPFVAWLGTAYLVVAPGLGALAVPVMAYMATIGLMLWRAAAMAAALPGRASQLALAGAVVFGASDTMIALDRFHAPVAGARYAIILTYWAALALLAASARETDRRPGRP